MWRLEYNAPRGLMVCTGVFSGITVDGMWVEGGKKVFVPEPKGGYSNTLLGCNSVRAFKSWLRRYGSGVKGQKVTLGSAYFIRGTDGKVSYDYTVTAVWEK